MINKFTIWHNPRCSKSRQALAVLTGNNCEPVIREYLKDVPSEQELLRVLKLLKISPIDICRQGESVFKSLKISEMCDNQAIISAIVANPILIERPIIIKDNEAAVIARPMENLEKII